MKYVILRDDDANGLTPPAVLEALYRPFLARGMRWHLATIPEVRTDIRRPDGALEGFLVGPRAGTPGSAPLAENAALTAYLTHEPLYTAVQHGYRHEFVDGTFEFQRRDRADLAARLDAGRERLLEAGLPPATTFVAPQDKLSREALDLVVERFPVLSTGWYDLGKVRRVDWPRYLWAKKVRGAPHWRSGDSVFFSHPGCILSYDRAVQGIVPALVDAVRANDITIVVSHHWEYFHGGQENGPLIAALHEFGEWLAAAKDVVVTSFADAAGRVR